jgi:cephalosporin-C deacetylase-like acetyl esterase
MTPVSAQLKLDVTIPAEGGIELAAWLFLPEGDGIRPAITMAHGFGGTREHGLERFAQAFAAAGFVVLVHDHRNFGTSGGDLRGDIDPWQQIADWRRAISYLESRPEVDPTRIGLWGTSYAGGHALVLGATDRRLCCVVAQVPTINGYEQACEGFHLTPRPRWSMLSTRTREAACTESCRAARQLLVATSLFLPPTARRTRSISIFSPFRKASGKTR